MNQQIFQIFYAKPNNRIRFLKKYFIISAGYLALCADKKTAPISRSCIIHKFGFWLALTNN